MPHNDAYSQVAAEEVKPLHDVDYDNDNDNDNDNDYAQHAEIQALKRSLQRTNLYLRILLALVGAAAAAYLANFVFGQVRHKEAACSGRVAQGDSGPAHEPLLLSPVPPLPDTVVTFRKNPIYAARPSPENNKAWNKLLPPGRGFVYIPDHENYTHLLPGQDTPWGMIYSTSLFHQMHCLGQIRSYTWDLLEAIEKNNTEKQRKMVKMLVEHDGGGHLNHCFDYLRQGIQCAGDMSMEWPRTEPSGLRIAVDGWDIPHVCKDWNVIMDYMDKMHFNYSMNDEIAPH